MIIPYQDLTEDTLHRLLEEFVSREGTDYGNYTYSLKDKVEHVFKQLKNKKAVINYDPETQSCNIQLLENIVLDDPKNYEQ